MTHTKTLHGLALTMALQVALAVSIESPCQAAGPQGDPAPPAIEIEKLTNGEDVDTDPGPSIPVGDEVAWTYVIINAGGETLYNVAVADSSPVDITCPGTETLEAGEMMTCAATMAVQPGPYRSQAIVAASTADGFVVDDSDPAFHVGTVAKGLKPAPSIAIEKLVEGRDADRAPGPSFPIGETVTWAFVVTNTGALPLSEVAVADSRGIDVTCLGSETLEPGESMTCSASAIVEPGQSRSLGLATGVAPDGTLVDGKDPSYHVGI